MSSLVYAALNVRRTARASFGFVAAAVFAGLVLLGVFRKPPTRLGIEHALVAVAWLAVFVARAATRLSHGPVRIGAWPHGEDAAGSAGNGVELELGLLLLVAVHAVVQMGGGVRSELYPLVYVLVAFFASFARRPAASTLLLGALLFEAGLYFLTEGHRAPQPYAAHASFIVVFWLLNMVFTRAEIARVRERTKREVDDEKKRMRQETRMFRLVSAPSQGGAADDERLFRSSVEEVHHQLYYVLKLLHRSLDLHTCILLLTENEGRQLRIVELVTESDDIAEGPFRAGEGVVGAVVERGHVMNLSHLRPGYKGLCYYQAPATVRSVIGVPVSEGGRPRGALCADRTEDRPFTSREEEIMQGAVRQVQRALENERVFVQLERSKREQSVLYRASQQLGAALDEEAVIDAGLSAAAEIARYDFAAITYYDPQTRRHTIRRAVGEDAARFDGLTFRDNPSLTSMAVKNRHYLPYRGEFDPAQQTVYTRRANLRAMRSLLILPLVVREDAIGTLTLAARRRDAFGDFVRPTLQVLANQIAVSVANAKSVRRLEEMATTDGLTGCLNKRAFMSELEQKMRSAERFDRNLSLIVTDIDHFKGVNDTYGHATGDLVIKELGRILTDMKRETDVVARFGGEEFCVLCEETGSEGAVQLAERVRESLEEATFQTEQGVLKVTCSLGVATFPADARDQNALFEMSDKALYLAKNQGRNQVCVATDGG